MAPLLRISGPLPPLWGCYARSLVLLFASNHNPNFWQFLMLISTESLCKILLLGICLRRLYSFYAIWQVRLSTDTWIDNFGFLGVISSICTRLLLISLFLNSVRGMRISLIRGLDLPFHLISKIRVLKVLVLGDQYWLCQRFINWVLSIAPSLWMLSQSLTRMTATLLGSFSLLKTE